MRRFPPKYVLFGTVPLLASVLAIKAAAQTSFNACRVPEVGAIYMIGVTGAPSACLDDTHVEFSWTEGGASLEEGSVTSVEIADGTVATADLADDAVTPAKLAPRRAFTLTDAASDGQTLLLFEGPGATGTGGASGIVAFNEGHAAWANRMRIANNRSPGLGGIDVITAGQIRFVITGDGKIGIGTRDPTNLLTVAQGSGTDPIADAWTTYSSRRWKTDIEPIEEPLDLVRGLSGVRFAWKDGGARDIGLIAEEVAEVVPEVASYGASGDVQGIDYARLVAVLIEAIKEQQVAIEAQEARIAELEERGGPS